MEVLLDMELQRLESASRMGGEVSSSVFVTLGFPRQLKGSCRVALPQSAYVSVFARLRVRLPTSSISVFVCLCGRATVVCTLTVCAVFHAV